MMFANQKRGETTINIDSKPYKICLTLGALAELETAFAVSDLNGICEKLKKASASDILLITGILLNAGGADFDLKSLKNARIEVKDAIFALNQAFALAFDNG